MAIYCPLPTLEGLSFFIQNHIQNKASKIFLTVFKTTSSFKHSTTISNTTSNNPNKTTITMPFFPQAYLSSEAGFLQLLSELDRASSPQPQQKSAPACARRCQPRRQQQEETFTPRFDVTETPTSYELFGEVPGLAQEDLNIEFTDAQTIVVKGKTVRAGTTIPQTETSAPAPVETEKDNDALSEKSHSATVEDEYDEADTPLAPTPATTATLASETPAPAAEKKAEAPKPRFWVSERKVGSFARSFSFSQRIEHDSVQAGLKNGVLHIVVPKVTKSGKIAVSVF